MVESGWYDDPMNVGAQLRFFDGTGWTNHTHPYTEADLPEHPETLDNESVTKDTTISFMKRIGFSKKPKKIKQPKMPRPVKLPTEEHVLTGASQIQKIIIILLSLVIVLALAGTLIIKFQ